ncbi:MAG: response regulator [Deferrisomatales bacterium]|nr:response regulator [Deferrisomatales bacterium]
MELVTNAAPVPRVLVVDDEEDITTVLGDILRDQGYAVETASDGSQAWDKAQTEPFDAVITDLKMPRMGGLELLRSIKEAGHATAVVIMTGFATVETAIEALKVGAYDYILKPFKVGELLQVVDRALEKVRLAAENLQLKEQVTLLRLSEAVASSLSLNQVLAIVVEAALKEVDADGVELLFRPPGSKELGKRLGLGRAGPLKPLLANVKQLEQALADAPHVQFQDQALADLLYRDAAATEAGIRTLLSVPLRRGNENLGVLNAYSRKARKAFLPREEKALMVLGDRAATSLENALLYANLENTFRETIQGLALALEAKDAYTHGHSENVTRLCSAAARIMVLDEEFCTTLHQAAVLHDIGKIGISSAILNKPSKLDPEEYEIIKSHPRMGKRILEPISMLSAVVPIIYHHHERWDGNGYPEGLAGEEIPLGSRLMMVADTYEAMTSDRAYRKGLPHQVAVDELRSCSGTQFDPECVKAFLAAQPKAPEPS